MEKKKSKSVSIRVSENFFNDVFEKERKRLENSLKFKISQPKFSDYLVKSDVKLVYPIKVNINTDLYNEPKKTKKKKK